MQLKSSFCALLCLTLSACSEAQKTDTDWIPIFDGKSLDGWTAKFAGHPLGENYKDTFRVVDGLLTVDYSNWDGFDDDFGHLFYKTPYSHYVIRATYRFIGEQVTNKKKYSWAFRNNGLMLHSQPPETMSIEQKFPTSIEVQLLGGDGQNPRSTANLCTPGSDIHIKDKRVTTHCLESDSKTFHGDQWVTVEVEVHGGEKLIHKVNGEVVMSYQKPVLEKAVEDKYKKIYQGTSMASGYISIQAETHPTQFKSIEVKPL
ncbi:3-keto-disaccharide hydrolase [Gayadomonas joobiniege]|uniref:3-keto-disaccharide hydrolase n=1 Tax=Gayadomonas joobiniege TaxID=1234606 RepID=UPI000380AB17|nr:DUF1080 domain-containing protein [Gayadomonas joobiniege]